MFVGYEHELAEKLKDLTGIYWHEMRREGPEGKRLHSTFHPSDTYETHYNLVVGEDVIEKRWDGKVLKVCD